MKIVMTTHYFHPHIGGIERHVSQVSQSLAKGGDEVHVITWRYDDTLPSISEENTVQIHRILDANWYKGTFRRLSGWAGMAGVREVWKNADVVHFHDYTPLIEWYLPFLPVNPRTFITFHGYEGYPIPRLSIALRRFSNIVVRGAVCAGGFIPKYYGTDCPNITYGGVDTPPRTGKTRRDGAVFVGSLRPDMGIMGYLNALSILKEQHGIELPLDVVGDGPLRDEVISFSGEKGIEVRLYGQKPDPVPFFKAAKVALVDSYLAILEAMASGTPVFSFYGNPLKKDYLYFFPGSGEILGIRDDPSHLAADLAGYLSKPETYSESVERAFAFAAEQTWGKVADLYRELYSGS